MLMQEYLRDNETSPFGDWFASLDPQAAAIVAVAVARLGEGNNSNVKPIGEGVGKSGSTGGQASGCISAGMANF